MRLLRTETDGRITLADYQHENRLPPYAILSHRWGPDKSEVTFEDMRDGAGLDKPGYEKLRFCSERSSKDGLRYFWIDTCCINKSNNTEYSKAINSMFQWYREAAKCYVYMADVESRSSFEQSSWFTRGWTLQELLGPRVVEFYARDRSYLGNKDNNSLGRLVESITGIDLEVLGNPERVHDSSIAARMSWASRRTTTVVEDEAYCLLGIFQVSMPLLYGEGKKSFHRLQEEIIKSSTDQTIFAWGLLGHADLWSGERRFKTPLTWPWKTLHRLLGSNYRKGAIAHSPILAPSPAAFVDCGDLLPRDMGVMQAPYGITNKGLMVTLPFVDEIDPHMLLSCCTKSDQSKILVLRLVPLSNGVYARALDEPPRWEWAKLWKRYPIRLVYLHMGRSGELLQVGWGMYSDSVQLGDLPPGYTISHHGSGWDPSRKLFRPRTDAHFSLFHHKRDLLSPVAIPVRILWAYADEACTSRPAGVKISMYNSTCSTLGAGLQHIWRRHPEVYWKVSCESAFGTRYVRADCIETRNPFRILTLHLTSNLRVYERYYFQFGYILMFLTLGLLLYFPPIKVIELISLTISLSFVGSLFYFAKKSRTRVSVIFFHSNFGSQSLAFQFSLEFLICFAIFILLTLFNNELVDRWVPASFLNTFLATFISPTLALLQSCLIYYGLLLELCGISQAQVGNVWKHAAAHFGYPFVVTLVAFSEKFLSSPFSYILLHIPMWMFIETFIPLHLSDKEDNLLRKEKVA